MFQSWEWSNPYLSLSLSELSSPVALTTNRICDIDPRTEGQTFQFLEARPDSAQSEGLGRSKLLWSTRQEIDKSNLNLCIFVITDIS